MNNDTQHQSGCSEKYAELCALSTTGELTPDEWADLEAHIAECGPCSELLAEYTSLASIGMAKLAPEIEPEPESIFSHRERKATHRLTAALHTTRPSEQSIPQPSMHAAIPINSRKRARQPIAFVGAAAVLLICIGGAFQIGRKFSGHTPQPAALAAVTPPAVPDTAKADLQKKLAVVQKSLDEISARSAEAEKRAAELSDTKASLLAQIDQLTKQDQVTTNSLVATTQQRDALQQQLSDTSKSLQQVNDDLSRARQDRQGAVLRVASLEQEINGLHATLAITDKSASTNEQFLAQDRDIRELMGARQLYIADVLDVQSDGQRSKPFGRVFYTKGKSLVFYAFDLQAQPDYHEAKAFQAWGKPDNPSAKPISLGIFYMDNEKNRRWALKSDNPDALAQIDAVFVTVEPKGGSPRPTGKPFLEAYLHTLPPNHP